MPPPLDAIPVALSSAVREVDRYPARHPEAAPLAGLAARMRRPAVVDPVGELGMASVVALLLLALLLLALLLAILLGLLLILLLLVLGLSLLLLRILLLLLLLQFVQ